MKRSFSMMNPVASLALMISFALLLSIASCTSASQQFTSKEDSLAFAKKVFEAYPEENSVIVNYALGDSDKFRAISWDEVNDFKKRYDAKPLIYGADGKPLKGFFIPMQDYSQIQSKAAIKGLYLRLAKRPDNSFTIMVLGLNEKGDVMDGTQQRAVADTTNFDFVPPCPDHCPPNFDN